MTARQAIAAARKRDTVTDGKDAGKISELLGPRWYTRGPERAVIQTSNGHFCVIRLEKLRKAER